MPIIEGIRYWSGYNTNEGSVYTNFASELDPAADDYSFYLNASGGI
jgi:hypothetical protein